MCTIPELKKELAKNNETRDKSLESKLALFYEKISSEIDSSIKKRLKHVETAPATKKELDSLSKNQDELLTKMTEIHDFYTGARFTQKFILWFFTTIGVIAGGILACKELFKKD